ncbi:dihydrodipicolinate synthase family protein [bacterium]|nr:dihydrodipicolinate synthase family protein [bacterium]
MCAAKKNIKEKLSGVFAPIITPFKNEEIILEKLKENIAKYNLTDLKGYMPLGSNGEYQGLTEEESLKVLDTVQKCKTNEKIIVAGCGRESAKATVEFIKKAAYYGLDMAFILTPHYFVKEMTNEALIGYFTYVANKSPIPIVIYNAPKFASEILITQELMAALAEHPNIIGMKNSSFFPISKYKEFIPENAEFYLLAGNIKTFYPGLVEGASGAVLSTASYLPEYCCELYQLHLTQKTKEAVKLHNFLNNLSSNTIGRFGVAGVKFALDIRGFFGGNPRIPLLPVKPEDKKQIIEYFQKEGIANFIGLSQ